jgi:hypothetical protein
MAIAARLSKRRAGLERRRLMWPANGRPMLGAEAVCSVAAYCMHQSDCTAQPFGRCEGFSGVGAIEVQAGATINYVPTTFSGLPTQ